MSTLSLLGFEYVEELCFRADVSRGVTLFRSVCWRPWPILTEQISCFVLFKLLLVYLVVN